MQKLIIFNSFNQNKYQSGFQNCFHKIRNRDSFYVFLNTFLIRKIFKFYLSTISILKQIKMINNKELRYQEELLTQIWIIFIVPKIIYFFYFLIYNKKMLFSKTKILPLLLLLIQLRSVISYPYLQQLNIPVSLSANQTILNNAIDVVNDYCVSIYYVTSFTNSSMLKIYQENVSETVRTNLSCSIIDLNTFLTPTFNVLKQAISIFYTNNAGGKYRILINKQNLIILSNSSLPAKYNGIYSKLWDVYYWSDQFDNQGIYNNIDNASPNLLNSGLFETGYTIKYFIDPLQSYVVTMYQNFNNFSYRQLLNNSQIVTTYSSPSFLTYDTGGYWHAFFKTDGKTFIIFQNSGNIVLFDLSTQIMFKKMVNLLGINTGYYQTSTNKIFFLVQSAVTLQTIVGYIDSNYSVHQNVSFFQQKYPKVSTNGNYLLLMNSSLLTVNVINKVLFCQTPGTYRDVNFALCQNCSANCLSCSSGLICSVCAANYAINASGICSLNAATNSSTSNSTYSAQIINIFLDNSIISTLNKVPTSRKLFDFVFYYFNNFDDFWLYQYHQRDYGSSMNALIYRIRNLQKLKWTIVDSQKLTSIYNQFNSNENQLISYFDGKIKYAGNKFQQLQQKGEGFFVNCWDLFTINLTMVLLMFFILRMAFRFLFNFKISKFLRPFSFWGYLGLIMIDGNLQYYFFLFLSQHKIGFSLSVFQKGLNFINYFFFFVCIWFTFSCYFLFYFFYKKLAKYFYDNNECNLDGIFGLIVSSSFKNLLLAAIHNFLRQNYHTQIPSLMAVEVIFLVFVLHQHKNSKSYKESHKLWINILFSWLKIIFQITLYLQQWFKSDGQLAYIFDEIIGIIIVLYLYLYYSGIAIMLIQKLSIISKNKNIEQKFNMNVQFQCSNQIKLEVSPTVASTEDSIYIVKINNFYDKSVKRNHKLRKIENVDKFKIVKIKQISKTKVKSSKIKQTKQFSNPNFLNIQMLLNKGKIIASKKKNILQRKEKISVQYI